MTFTQWCGVGLLCLMAVGWILERPKVKTWFSQMGDKVAGDIR